MNLNVEVTLNTVGGCGYRVVCHVGNTGRLHTRRACFLDMSEHYSREANTLDHLASTTSNFACTPSA